MTDPKILAWTEAERLDLADFLAALDHVRTSAFYGARKRFRGIRLIATDTDWSAGTGPEELHATDADLLLLATGRPAGLTSACGSATDRITAAL